MYLDYTVHALWVHEDLYVIYRDITVGPIQNVASV